MKYKRFLPYLFIIFVWLVFAAPYLLFGKTPFPSAYQVNFFAPWGSYSEFASPYKNGAIPDVIGQIYPWKKFTIETLKTGQIPLWNPYSFSGTPHLANYQSAVFAPINILFFIFSFTAAWNIAILLQPLLAGLFMYFYVRSLKLSKMASVFASVSFMFCGFVVSWMPYGTLGYSILFLPLAFFAIEKWFSEVRMRYLILLSATIPLSFYSGHFQTSLYFLMAVGGYLVYKIIVTRIIKTGVYSTASIICGLLLSAPQLFPSISLYSQSLRSTLVQATEAIPWGYLPTLIAPDIFGNPVTRNDWFGHYAEWNAYSGLVPLIFGIYAVSRRKKSEVFFFLLLAGLAILLAFESPLLNLIVMLKIPVLSTSAASRVIVLFSFACAVLSAFGLDYFMQDVHQRKKKALIVVFSIFTLLLLALWSIVVFKIILPFDKIQIARSNLLLPTAIFMTTLILIGLYVKLKKWSKVKILIFILLALTVFDMYRFTTKWMPRDPQSLVYAKTSVSGFFPKISGSNRVFGPFGAEASVYYSLPSAEGYDAVYIRRYGQFIASLDLGAPIDSFRSVVAFPKNGKYSLSGANLLGIKYIVHKISDAQKVWAFPFWKYDSTSIKLLFDDGRYQVLENTNALPRAFIVNSVKVENTPQKIINTMFKPDVNLRNTAVVEEGLPGESSGGNAKIIQYSPNRVSVETKSQKSSFLVLTDSFDPGWRATIDSNPTKIYRTDYAFRGVKIPKGRHIVEFVYQPASFTYGVVAAIMGLVGLIILVYVLSKSKTFKKSHKS